VDAFAFDDATVAFRGAATARPGLVVTSWSGVPVSAARSPVAPLRAGLASLAGQGSFVTPPALPYFSRRRCSRFFASIRLLDSWLRQYAIVAGLLASVVVKRRLGSLMPDYLVGFRRGAHE
jgi:hypothetical protein